MATPTTLPASFVSGAVLEAAQLNNLRGAFRILQVVSTVKTDTFTTTSGTFVDVTGLSATITPSSTSSKILIVAQVTHALENNQSYGFFRLSGGNSTTYVGATPSNRVASVFGGYFTPNGSNVTLSGSIIYLDSPATISATTYVVQARRGIAGTAYVNRSSGDTDDANHARGASSITVMEVSA